MRKIYTYILLLMCAVSCAQHEPAGGNLVTISAVFPDKIESKVAIVEKDGDTGLELSWEDSDKLIVKGESSESVFTLKSRNGKSATFIGEEVDGEVFDVVLTRGENNGENRYLLQHQTGVAATQHLEYDAHLKGVDTYTEVKFSDEWANAHGGSLLQSGCLLLYFQLPEQLSAASTVCQVKIEASSPTFCISDDESSPKSSHLTMDITDGVVGQDKTVKAYMMTSMNESRIGAETCIRLTVTTEDGVYIKDFVPGEKTIVPGMRNVIKLNSQNWKPIVESKDFTFMTYNVGRFNKFEDDLGHESYPEASAILKYYKADIVGLNEIELKRIIVDINNQPKKLADEMGEGWTYYFAPATGDDYGNAILASPKLKAIESYCIDLPCVTSGYQTRTLGVVEYEDFVFCVTHLDHHNRTNREPQIRDINSWVKENYGNINKPIILTGDMNATPGAPEIKTIYGECWTIVSEIGKSPNYVTTYRKIEDDGSVTTKCLDYILLWKNDNIEYTVNDTKAIQECPGVEDITLVSDHNPVYVNMTFKIKHALDLKDAVSGGLDRLPDDFIFQEEF